MSFRDDNLHAHAKSIERPMEMIYSHSLTHMCNFISTHTRLVILMAASLVAGIHPVSGNVLMQIGATTGGNNQLSSAKSYTYNFGITSAAAGLNLNQIILGIGRQGGVTEGITIEIYPAFGGVASGQAPISTTFFAASTFSGGASRTNYTLALPELNLAPGAYSIRVFSNTPSNASYAFTDGVLTLGGAVSESQWIQDSNTGGTAGTSIAPAAGYVLADRAISNNNINLGRFHIGNGAQSAVATLTNSAPATSGSVTESLSVSQGTVTGGVSVSSLPTNPILQGGTHQIGVSLAAVAGDQTGSIQLNFASVKDGSNSTRSGNDPVSLAANTIQVSGFGYTGRSEWVEDANGTWDVDSFANWDHEGGTPGLDGAASVGDTALFGAAATANRTITLNGNNPNLRELVFDNETASYTIEGSPGSSIAMGNATHAGVIENRQGSHQLGLDLALSRDLAFSGTRDSVLTISGAISGNDRGLAVDGEGTLVLDGRNTYSGKTRINGGTLTLGASGSIEDSNEIVLAAGSILNVSGHTSGYTFGASQTLSGGGTIVGNTIISGTHNPGFSPGIQTADGDLGYTTGSNIIWELIDNTIAGRGTNYDGIDVIGNLTFSGATTLTLDFALADSNVDWSESFWDQSHLGISGGWMIFSVTGEISGFENLQLGGSLLDSKGVSLSASRGNFFLSKEVDGIYLNYTVIPEPRATFLAALALLLAWRRNRG